MTYDYFHLFSISLPEPVSGPCCFSRIILRRGPSCNAMSKHDPVTKQTHHHWVFGSCSLCVEQWWCCSQLWFDYKRIWVHNISDYDGNLQLRTEQKINVPPRTQKHRRTVIIFPSPFLQGIFQVFFSSVTRVGFSLFKYRYIDAYLNFVRASHASCVQTNYSSQTCQRREHSDRTTCVTTFAAPNPKPRSGLNSENPTAPAQTQRIHTPPFDR